MIYRKLKRTWSHNNINYTPRLKEVFPELNKVSSEELALRFEELKMDFYYEKKEPVGIWMRLTFPFALIIMVLMLIGLPINFLITGEWGYVVRSKGWLMNWFRAVKLQ